MKPTDLIVAALLFAGSSMTPLLQAEQPAASATSTPVPEETREQDRRLLRQLESGQAATAPKPTPAVTKPAATPSQAAATPAKPVASKTPEKKVAHKSKANKTSRIAVAPAPVAEQPREEIVVIPQDRRQIEHRVDEFVRDFVKSEERGDVPGYVSHFGDRVNYYQDRRAGRDSIAREVDQFNARWPRRSFSIKDDPDIVFDGDSYVVQFPVKYSVRNGPEKAKGTVLYTMRLGQAQDGFRILSLQEQPLRGD